MSIYGESASGFEPVGKAFEEHAKEVGRGGAAFSAYLGEQKVVDLWSGSARPGEEWQRDTVSIFYSSSKVAAGIVAMLAHDRGQLDFDVPVANYWSEFAQNGKEAVTVRQLLAMQAGLPYVPNFEGFLIPGGAGWDQIEEVERRLAQSPPLTEIGEPCYAPVTFGFLVNAVVRRAAGRQVKEIWNEDVAGPLGLDLSLGGPESARVRMAQIYDADGGHRQAPPGSLLAKCLHLGESQPPFTDLLAAYGMNPVHLHGGIASSDLLGTAESMAKVYAMLINGGTFAGTKILTPQTVGLFTAVQSTAPDLYTAEGEVGAPPSGWMLGGIEANHAHAFGQPLPYGPNPRTYGKGGAGGQMGFADPDQRMSVGFIRSHLTNTSPLLNHLVDALYSCLP